LEILKRSSIEQQINIIKINADLSLLQHNLHNKNIVISTNGDTKNTQTISKKEILKKIADIQKRYSETTLQWNEYAENELQELKNSVEQFFSKYIGMSVKDKNAFQVNIKSVISSTYAKINATESMIKDTDAYLQSIFPQIHTKTLNEVQQIENEKRRDTYTTDLADDVLSENGRKQNDFQLQTNACNLEEVLL
jgi:hypothetical protein